MGTSIIQAHRAVPTYGGTRAMVVVVVVEVVGVFIVLHVVPPVIAVAV